jgi:hypothetical protein
VTFVHLNFFRDNAPVKKVAVYQNSTHPCLWLTILLVT